MWEHKEKDNVVVELGVGSFGVGEEREKANRSKKTNDVSISPTLTLYAYKVNLRRNTEEMEFSTTKRQGINYYFP